MAVPAEDQVPAWLRDWTHVRVDPQQLADFAAQLRAEVQLNYVPHLQRVYDDMTSTLPPPPLEFAELVRLLTAHQQSQTTTADNVHSFANATSGFAAAADEISRRYERVDAFAAARVGVVDDALHRNGVVPPAGGQPVEPGSPAATGG